MIFENATATELKEASGGNRTRRVLSEKQRDSKAKLVRINILRTDLSEETISLEYFLDSISKFYLADGEHAEVTTFPPSFFLPLGSFGWPLPKLSPIN